MKMLRTRAAVSAAVRTDEIDTSPARMPASVSQRLAKDTGTGKQKHRRQVISTVMTILVLLSLNGLMQLNRRYWDVQSDGTFGLRRVQQCESLGRVPDVLYLGSSLGAFGIRPQVVDTAVRQGLGRSVLSCNAASLGSTYEEDYYTLKRFIEDGYIPRSLVEVTWEYNLNVNAVPSADEDSIALVRVAMLADVTDSRSLQAQFGSGASGASNLLQFAATKAIPMYGDRVGLYKAACGSLRIGPCGQSTWTVDATQVGQYTSSDKQGFMIPAPTTLASWSPQRIQGNTAALYGAYNYHFTIGGQQGGYLDKLITLAQAHHIQVNLIQTPVSSAYMSAFELPSDWTMIMQYWQSIAQAHDIPFYDESFAPGYTSADFVDPHHLSPAGASKFSLWLAARIVGPVAR